MLPSDTAEIGDEKDGVTDVECALEDVSSEGDVLTIFVVGLTVDVVVTA